MLEKNVSLLRHTTNFGRGIPGLSGDETCLALNHGFLSLIDPDDVDELSKCSWLALVQKSRVYAVRNAVTVKGIRKKIYLHRELTKPSDGQDVDHKDQHKFFCFKLVDNRRSNLRVLSRSQNNANQRKTRGTSRFKGVCWDKTRCKWKAQIKVDQRRFNLCHSDSETEAALAYNEAHKLYFPGISEGLNDLQSV